MYEITCLDNEGNSINYFTQWDCNQKIRIVSEGLDADYFEVVPKVHFANVKSESAIVVGEPNVIITTTETANDTIVVDVPNELLQEAYPLLVYVYYENNEDGDYIADGNETVIYASPQRVILQTEIPVRKRVLPSDYLYVQNIKRITANSIKMEVEEETRIVRENAINDITQTKDDATAFITETKDAAEAYINNVRDEAETYINNVRDEAKEYIDENKADFIATGEQIIADVNQIKSDTNDIKTATDTVYNNTVAVYEDTVAVANQTKAEIEEDIRVMMLESGMTLISTNDGNGNVTTTFVINQT